MFIMYGDDNTAVKTKLVIVPVLVGLNVFCFVLYLYLGESMLAWSCTPYEIRNGVDLVGDVPIQLGGEAGTIRHYSLPVTVYLTLFTSLFLHGNWAHIGFNTLYLIVFGDQLEHRLGRTRFTLFYLSCGFVAAMSHVLMYQDSLVPMIGASGAIAGVLGGYLVFHPQNTVHFLWFILTFKWMAWGPILIWFALQTIAQFGVTRETVGVAYLAHIGGFLFGALLATLYLGLEFGHARMRRRLGLIVPAKVTAQD